MKYIYSLFLVVFLKVLCYGQQITLLTTLQDSIEETSGLIYLNQKIITHNDSGGEPMLFEIDSISGQVTRSVMIDSAFNTDWEDICYDSTYIYIADFGNNNGSRTDLKIYRMSISDYFTTTNDTVIADKINFTYADQTDFTPSPFSTNFDAEAIISYQDSLFIFTKNWGNKWTYIYALSKMPGSYQIEKVDSIDVQGLITGATIDDLSKNILLTGYTFSFPSVPFIVEISDFTSNDFSNGTINRYLIEPPAGYSIQIEGITYLQANEYYLSAEVNASGPPSLYKLDHVPLSIGTIKDLESYLIYPNPTSNLVQLRDIDFAAVEIYDAQGILKKTSNSQPIWITDLSKGVYFVVVLHSNGEKIFSEKLIIH